MEVMSLGRRNAADEVEIWVPHTMDSAVLDAKIAALRAQGFRVILFRSGRGDLLELSRELLRANRDLDG